VSEQVNERITEQITYRAFTGDDIAAAHALTVELKWPHRADDWRFVVQAGAGFVAEAADGDQAVANALETRPDLVLMDIRMPVLDGIEATRQLVPQLGTTRVLMLTTFDLDAYVYEALRAGASGFLLKDARAAELVHAVRVIAAIATPRRPRTRGSTSIMGNHARIGSFDVRQLPASQYNGAALHFQLPPWPQ